jgi:succinate dehydrogenase/fumarate reductase flavoprotein subunit
LLTIRSGSPGEFFPEPPKRIPIRKFDVVIAGGGTAGVVAALAAARQGAKTALIELKGYTGGMVTEGGTALHSFFNNGFHDMAPRLQVKNGGTYGIPYRALRAAGIENLLCAGMMITSDHRAHMSTRNTVSCMAQGQAAGTAAALCAAQKCGTRALPYRDLKDALLRAGVYLEG